MLSYKGCSFWNKNCGAMPVGNWNKKIGMKAVIFEGWISTEKNYNSEDLWVSPLGTVVPKQINLIQD